MKLRFAAVLVFLFVALAGRAAAPRDMAAEARIERELQLLDPTAVEPFRQARIAYDAGDFARSVSLLRELRTKVPTFDPVVRRLGTALAASGQRDEGLRLTEQALAMKRSAANLSSVAYFLMYHPNGRASDGDLRRAQALLREARALPDGADIGTLVIACQAALLLQDYPEARVLAAQLEKLAPDAMETHLFAAYAAASEEKWLKADREMKRARKLGFDATAAQQFFDSGIHWRANGLRAMLVTAWVVGAWLLGLGTLCALGFILSRLTLRQIERGDPTVSITDGERRLRQIYRGVLNVAGVYYYISLPVVVVLVIGVAAAIVGGLLMAGWLAIKLTLILAIGAIATIWSMGRSLFIKVPVADPGRALAREEAAGLWQLAEEVAATVQTRPVDEIRITEGTDLCVYERGSWREKMDGRAARVLVIGAAVLDGFRQEDFRSVLAHEYGHFAHRDTAGGDVALRVRNDIWKFYLAMVSAGQATKLNVAFHFLRFYHFIFRRISHGATRLQEVLADRVAAQAYGTAAFEGGLRHAVRRAIEFDAIANTEIKAAIDAERPVRNLYDPTSTRSDSVEKDFEAAINRQTTADDTHPSPADRFRLISRIVSPKRPADERLVWELFSDAAAVQKEMMARIEKQILRHRGTAYQPPATA